MPGKLRARNRTEPRRLRNVKRRLFLLSLVSLLVLTGTAVAAHRVWIRGTNHSETLVGTAGPDGIAARGGNDTVQALAGNDLIFAGRGNDAVDAGDGDDVAWGGAGNDQLQGGLGNDRLRGRYGDDSLDGGPGNDRLHGGWGTDQLQGGDGNDRLFALAPDNKVDTLDCGPGDHDVAWELSTEHDVITNCEVVKTVTVSNPGE